MKKSRGTTIQYIQRYVLLNDLTTNLYIYFQMNVEKIQLMHVNIEIK